MRQAPEPSSMRTVKLVVLGATTVFVVACVFSIGGLADDRDWGDVGHYQTFGARVMDGGEPYHDFYMEYPPGALPAFVLPSTVSDGSEVSAYRFRFKLLMTVCGLAMLLVAAAILRHVPALATHAAGSLSRRPARSSIRRETVRADRPAAHSDPAVAPQGRAGGRSGSRRVRSDLARCLRLLPARVTRVVAPARWRPPLGRRLTPRPRSIGPARCRPAAPSR